jgi:hypothetical protein
MQDYTEYIFCVLEFLNNIQTDSSKEHLQNANPYWYAITFKHIWDGIQQ